MLSVGSKKAGSVVSCPKCIADIDVPDAPTVEKDWRSEPPPLRQDSPETASKDNASNIEDSRTQIRKTKPSDNVVEKSIGYLVVAYCVLVPAFAGLQWILGFGIAASSTIEFFLYGIGFIVVAAIIFIQLANAAGYFECRACGKWSTKTTRQELVSEEKAYGLVTRTATSSGRGAFTGGNFVVGSGTTEWEERVPVIRKTFCRYAKCDKCGHETSEKVVEEEEDFNRK